MRQLYSGVGDLEQYQMPKLRLRSSIGSSTKMMRIRYALKDIEEDKMKRKLEQDDRKQKHWIQVLNVVELLYDVLKNTINNMVHVGTLEVIQQGMEQHHAIVNHVNLRLVQISKMTKMQTPRVNMYSLLQYVYY